MLLGRRYRSETYKTKELLPVQPGFLCFESPTAQFARSQHNLFRTMTESCKGPMGMTRVKTKSTQTQTREKSGIRAFPNYLGAR